MSHWKRFPSKVWLVIPLLSLVFLAVACGAAATPTPVPTAVLKATPQPVAPAAPVAAPAPAPTVAAVATPVPKAAPAPTSVPVPAAKVHPGKLTIMVGDLANERFDQALVGGASRSATFVRVMGGFLISDSEKKQMVPGIASQWGLSADGLTWTFTIRKGVKFYDGSELTPQDVLWTLQHYFGPQASEYNAGTFAAKVSRVIDKIELTESDKVSLTTKTPFPDLAINVSEAGSNPHHMMPKRAKLHDTQEEVAYDNNPIGAGFMRLEKHVRAYVMKFERFDDFYYQPKNGFPEDKRVNFQSLDLLVVPEEATRVAAVRAGEADLAPVSLATKKQVEAGGGRVVFGLEGVAVEVKLMACYEAKYPCHDRRVRQALDYAIDKELIRDRLYGGPHVFQIKGWAVVTPSTIGYTPALDPRPFDPNKARQLLADAGYPGGKGFGKLIVNTYPATSLPLQPEAAQLAAEFWRKELGLDVEVRVSDSTGIQKRQLAGDLNGQILWRDKDARTDASGFTASFYGEIKDVNHLHEDPELFRLVQETLRILDPDKRAEASNKLFLRLRDESYNLGVGYVNIPWAVGPRVLTWRPYPVSEAPSALHTITLK